MTKTTFPFSDPFLWFQSELQKAIDEKLPDPNAMQLATVSAEGLPSVRTVFYKGMVRDGFSFYTNYESSKSKDLLQTKRAGLNFFWPTLEQQIRIEGVVEKLTRQESEAYFATRVRLSQIGAWASHQSQQIPSLDWLEKRVHEFEKKFENQNVPCPPNWGGFHLLPLRIEFWFGRRGRLHERYVFERPNVQVGNSWVQSLRSP